LFSKIFSKGKRPPLRLLGIISAITIALVAVVIFLDVHTNREIKVMALKQFNRQQMISARSIATGIEAYSGALIETLLSLTKMHTIQRMAPECLQCIQHTYWGFPLRTSIRLLDRNGILRFIYPFDGWRGELIGRDYSEEQYFQEPRKTGRIITSGLVINGQGDKRIRIAVPIYLTHKTETVRVGDGTGIITKPFEPGRSKPGRFQGVLVGSIDPSIIAQNFITPIVSGETGYAWLLNQDGIFLAHHEEGFTGRNAFEVRKEKNPDIFYDAIEQIQLKMMAGEEGVGRYISGWHRGQIGEIEKFIAYTPIHINSHIWSVAVCAPVNEVERIVYRATRSEWFTVTFVILVLIIGGFLFFIVSYRWSHFLEREVEVKTGELRETGEYLNNLIRHANAPIIVWNPDKRITIFNKAFETMSGRSEAEMMKQMLDVLFPEESRSNSLQKIESASKGEYWESVEIPIMGADGEIRIALWNSANIYSEDGKTLIATIAQGQDITERKKTGEALRESEKKYRLLVDHANEAIFIAQDEVIKFPNSRTEELIGYNKEELGKIPFINIIHPEDRDMVLDRYERRLKGEEPPSTYSFRMINKAGVELTVHLNTILITWEERPATLNFIRDITQQKRLEAQLLQAQKMESIGTLSGGIAHDFNNLLAGIQGNVSLMLLDIDSSYTHYEKLKSIEECVQSGTGLTKQLLGFARSGKYETRPADLNKLIEKTSTMFERTKKELNIYRKYQKDIWTVEVDEGQIEQVLLNLYVNAWQAMPEGGELYLQSENVTLDDAYKKPFSVKPGEYVKVSVTDTGVGMDEETQKRIFDPFFTTREMGRGTGLGLASVYGIIKNHDGIINVYSEMGEGTTFNIYLTASGKELTEKRRAAEEVLKGTETVLLVDDEVIFTDVSSQMLEKLGYEILTARNGKEAVNIYKENKEKIDMVILDMIMPGMSGGEVYNKLKEINPGIKVLLSSGYSINGQAKEILERGCSGFLQKPFSIKKLSQKIREILDIKSP